MLAALLLLAAISCATPASAQGIDGHADVAVNVMPGGTRDSAEEPGATELRARLFAEHRIEAGERLRLTAAGFIEALAADRAGAAGDVILRPQELHAELLWSFADLRVGLSRVTWGKLDEFLPTDVVNPLDVARFFLDGRAEARLPVAMVRGRLYPSEGAAIEMIYVPFFRRGRFDQLDEASSPFNLARTAAPAPVREPRHALRHGQGGVRASFTTGRVDWAVSAYRGFEPLPVYGVGPQGLIGDHPRFTMVGVDVETVRGSWGVRGELAAFPDRVLAVESPPFALKGSMIEAGVGVDRRTGEYRLAGSVLISKRSLPAGVPREAPDVMLVGALDRSFARQTRWVRAFGVYNPIDDSAFGRVVLAISPADDVRIELSGGVFSGSGRDVPSLLATRDFFTARLKVFF